MLLRDYILTRCSRDHQTTRMGKNTRESVTLNAVPGYLSLRKI